MIITRHVHFRKSSEYLSIFESDRFEAREFRRRRLTRADYFLELIRLRAVSIPR